MTHAFVLIIIVGALCGLACVPGALLLKAFENRRRPGPGVTPGPSVEGAAPSHDFFRAFGGPARFWASFAPAMLAGTLATTLHWDVAIERRLFPRSAATASTQTLLDDPVFIRRSSGMNPEEVRAFVRELTAKGVRRLSTPELRKLGAIRHQLTKISPVVCASYWTGVTDKASWSAATEAAIRQLKDADYNELLALTSHGAILELHGEGETAFVQDDAKGIESVKAALGDRRAEFGRILDLAASATPAEGCKAIQMIYEAAPSIPDSDVRSALGIIGDP